MHGSSPSHLDAQKRQSLRLKFSQYQMINGVLFHQNYINVLLRYLEKDDVVQVLTKLHGGLAGKHFNKETTMHKVLREGYYWSTMFKYAHSYGRKCEIFQVNAGTERRPTFPLQQVTVQNPFQQWGLDIVDEINPNSSKNHKYILTTTNHFYRSIEAIPLKAINENEVIQFLQGNIITRFGVLSCLVFYNPTYLSSSNIVEFALKHNMNIKYLSNYYS